MYIFLRSRNSSEPQCHVLGRPDGHQLSIHSQRCQHWRLLLSTHLHHCACDWCVHYSKQQQHHWCVWLSIPVSLQCEQPIGELLDGRWWQRGFRTVSHCRLNSSGHHVCPGIYNICIWRTRSFLYYCDWPSTSYVEGLIRASTMPKFPFCAPRLVMQSNKSPLDSSTLRPEIKIP